MENSIPDCVTCILCRGAVIYRDGDKMRFREHMRSEHGAFFDLDFLLASCLMDVQSKESWARTVRTVDCGEGEETLRENTNYEKDDQTSSSASNEEVDSSQVKPEPSPKKKRGRKKKVKAEISSPKPEDSLNNPSEETENVESVYSDVDSMDTSSSSYQEENVESLLSEAREEKPGEDERERFICQVESCGKSYNTKGNRMTHEKKAHGILGPRAAKKQRMSVSTEEAQSEEAQPQDLATTETGDVFNETPSGSFLTDTSLGYEDVPEENEENEDSAIAPPEEETKTVGEIDLSSSNYFKKNPKILNTARGKSLHLFDQENPCLPQGWKQRILTVANKSGEKVMNKHYLSPELKVLKSGMAVVEYLRLKGDFDIDQLKLLAKDLKIADKKFQSLFSD